MAPISLKKGFVDELGKELVMYFLNIEENEQNFKLAIEYVMSNLRFHRFLDVNPLDVSKSLKGLCSKFRVNSQEEKAVHLESLVEEFVNQPLIQYKDEDNKQIQTDAHYALLSLLLNSSNNPLKNDFMPKKDDKIEKTEEASFNWASYLLSGEERLHIGADIDEDTKLKLCDSGDELWDFSDDELYDFDDESDKEEEKEEEEEVKLTLPACDKSSDFFKVNEYHETNEVTWIYKNVVPSYWSDKESLDFKINNDNYAVGYSEICRNWEIYKGKTNVKSNINCYKLLTEKQVVIETLWMLQGIENLYVYKFVEDKYIPNEDVALTHLTEETLKIYLNTFTSVGNKIVDLKKYSERVLNGVEPVSKSFTAFGYVLGRYLMERCLFLAGIEKTVINKDESVTLLVLKGLLMDDTLCVKCIHQLYTDAVYTGHQLYSTETERVVYFMDIFYARLCMFDALGDVGHANVLKILPMFLDICQPYLNDIDNWMTMGKLPNAGDEEFMIYRAKDIEKGEADYWSQTYKIKEAKVTGKKVSNLVPMFVQGMQKKILLAGKSLGLLAEFGNYATNICSPKRLHEEFKENLKNRLREVNDQILKGFEANEYVDDGSFAYIEDLSEDPLINENFKLMFLDVFKKVQYGKRNGGNVDRLNQFNEWIELLDDGSCRPPIKLLLEQCLFPVISKRYDKACAFLLEFFKTELKLFHHLEVMGNFFLTQAGGTMHAFFSELFDMAKRKVYWQDMAYLNIVLQDALQLHYPDMIESLRVDLQSSELRSNANLFDGLSLHYDAPWPITIILDVKTEQKYNEILKFLLKVKRAIWALEQLRFHELLATLSAETSCDDTLLSDDDGPPRRRKIVRDDIILDPSKQKLKLRLVILRMKMLHVIHSFHFYLMTRIKNATSVEFQPKVKEAKDLGEILEIHHSFLLNLKKKCFLQENIGRSKEAIFRILSLVFDFEVLWISSIYNIDSKRLDVIDNDFHRCKAFLHSFFSTLGKRGSYPHFEFLAHSLKS